GSALALPADTTSPPKHSGDAGHRAAATRRAAGQPALVVGIPNTSVAAAPPPWARGLVPVPEDPVPAGPALEGPAADPLPCGRNRVPMSRAAALITTSPPASASCRAGHRGPLGTCAPVAGPGMS